MNIRLLLLLPCLLTSCAVTDYRGPSIGVSLGWQGVEVGIRLYSSDPVPSPIPPKEETPVVVTVQK